MRRISSSGTEHGAGQPHGTIDREGATLLRERHAASTVPLVDNFAFWFVFAALLHTSCTTTAVAVLAALVQHRLAQCCASQDPHSLLAYLETTTATTTKMAATFLPAPRHKYEVHADESLSAMLAPAPKQKVPPYGRRQSFVPRAQADFGDGGAFPEIHVAQFPLEMGRPTAKKAGGAAGDGKAGGGGGGGGVGGISGLGNNSGSTAIVAVDVDENGKVREMMAMAMVMVVVKTMVLVAAVLLLLLLVSRGSHDVVNIGCLGLVVYSLIILNIDTYPLHK